MVELDPKAINAFAEAWASMDGKLHDYCLERDEKMPLDDPRCKGCWEGYGAEAAEMIRRLRTRGFDVTPIAEPFHV